MDALIKTITDGLMEAFHNEYLVVFLIAMLPMIEVKGAIPIAVSLGIAPWAACLFSILSSLVVCPIILFCLKPILNALKKTKWFNKFAQSVEDVFVGKAQKAEKKERSEKQKNLFKMLALFLFVALPLPLTGVWTGCGVAVFMQKKYRYSIIPIVLGCAVQAVVFTLIAAFAPEASGWLVLIVGIFVLVSLAVFVAQLLVKRLIRKKNACAICAGENEETETESDSEKIVENESFSIEKEQKNEENGLKKAENCPKIAQNGLKNAEKPAKNGQNSVEKREKAFEKREKTLVSPPDVKDKK